MRTFRKRIFIITLLLTLAFSSVSFAEEGENKGAGNPEFVSNAVKLAEDALKWILVLVPITGGLMVGWHAWRKSLADGEPGEVHDRNKRIKNVIISSIIAMSAAGLVTLFLSYFEKK